MSLACTGLTLAYSAKFEPVLRNVTIDFAPGQLTSVTGPSGSGKSTLLYVLSMLLRPTAGTVTWQGVHLTDLPDGECSRWRAATVGFVFQDAMLDPARSVLDNVCEPAIFAGMGRREARARARQLLDRFGIGHRLNHRPGEVSGGQAQRVGLCRALLTRPALVFGDEPTGNLDRDSAAIVWDALRDLAQGGATVVVATHDEALADRVDERIRL